MNAERLETTIGGTVILPVGTCCDLWPACDCLDPDLIIEDAEEVELLINGQPATWTEYCAWQFGDDPDPVIDEAEEVELLINSKPATWLEYCEWQFGSESRA